MSINKSLKKVLSKDMENNLLISAKTAIYKDKNKFDHIYSYSDTFKCNHNGFIEFEFNNEKAWFWNKDIEVSLKITDREIKLNDFFTEFENIEYLGDNKFLFKKIKKECSFMIKMEKDEVLDWSFSVWDNNSIDFKLFFKIDYLGVLDNFIRLNDILEDEISIKKFYIDDLEQKANKNEKVINSQQGIIEDLNYNINKEDKTIKSLKDRIKDLESKLEDKKNKTKEKNNKDIFDFSNSQNNLLHNFLNAPVNPWNEFNREIDYPYKRTRSNRYFGK